ncbi:MAG: ATP-binding protein [Paracoccaceae bacterium]
MALACTMASLLSATEPSRLGFLAGTVTFLAMIAALRMGRLFDRWRDRRRARGLALLTAFDASPCFTTDGMGQIRYRNSAAEARFGLTASTLVSAMQDHFASPSAVLYRLQTRAGTQGSAREDVVTRRGHLRLSAHRVAAGRFLWRMEEFHDRGGQGRGAETLSLPMLVANKAGVVLFTNEAMRRLLGGRPKRLDRVFANPVLHSGEEVEVAAAAGPVRAILAEVEGVGERREIYLLPVADRGDEDAVLADFEHVPVALMRFSSDGTLRAANRAAREIAGLQPTDVPMMHDLFEGLGRPVTDWLADVADERSPGGTEILCLRGGEGESFMQVTLRRMVEAGRPGVLAVLQDATALKTLEAQFAQSQKMHAIGQLAGGIAHDFNNLLTAISGHCDLLLLNHDRDDPDYPDLAQIHDNANRAAALVGQLLAFSRKQTLKPERLDLHEVLADLIHLLKRLVGERVRLQLAHSGDVGTIRADKRQLEQVIMNLVVNARDAMPAGGTVRLSTERLTLAEEITREAAVIPAGEYAVIRVTDSGVGIPPDRLEKIFEPFYTTKRAGEGTGLGLSTAYGIVKQSGGFIFVESQQGEGTEFTLIFPIHSGPPDQVAASAPRRIMLRQGEGVVLLVEDEAPVRAFASRALRMRGYTVIEAENAEQALEALRDPRLEVDIFVTDVVMPGMDGPSWVRQALVDRPNVRVIFVSGYAEDCLQENQARIPNSVFLPKPFSLSDLAETVQGQLH